MEITNDYRFPKEYLHGPPSRSYRSGLIASRGKFVRPSVKYVDDYKRIPLTNWLSEPIIA